MSTKLIGRDRAQHRPSEETDATWLQAFEAHLRVRGHRDSAVGRYLEAARHFAGWLAEQPAARRQINTATVSDFLNDHLPICACTPPAPRHRKSVRAALNQLLIMRGQQRLRAPRPRVSEDIETTICRFDAYQRDVSGLAQSTRWGRCRFARDFLDALFGARPLEYDRIVPQALVQYVTGQAHHYRPGTVGVLACALRSFLRFLQFEGTLATGLAGAVPTPANWSLATLPASLSDAELERFWNAFDPATAIGKRDYAMARCLGDLALRCQEVADLRLEAIDWRAGVLHLPQTKSQRADRLPLPHATGQALVDYLRRGRPVSSSRAVFLYHRAPLGAAVAKTTVRDAIRRAFARADLPWSGTHVLRHTAATRLLQAGRSLKEIADVLRHRSIDTTAIYTKVDLPHLSGVALPWPERQS